MVLVERAEQLLGLLAAEVDEHVEAAAVGHADDEVGDLQAGGPVKELLQGVHHGLAAFDGEALGAHESAVEETFELLGLDEGAEEAAAGVGVIGRAEAARLRALLQPAATGAVLDVRELDPDRSAVDGPELREDFRQGQGLAAEEVARVEGTVKGDAVESQGLVGQAEVGLRVEQGVDPGLEVAEHPIGLDGRQHLELGHGIDGAGRAGRGLAGFGRQAEPEFEAFEESTPVGVHGQRVLRPALMVRGDKVGVPTGSYAQVFHFGDR